MIVCPSQVFHFFQRRPIYQFLPSSTYSHFIHLCNLKRHHPSFLAIKTATNTIKIITAVIFNPPKLLLRYSVICYFCSFNESHHTFLYCCNQLSCVGYYIFAMRENDFYQTVFIIFDRINFYWFSTRLQICTFINCRFFIRKNQNSCFYSFAYNHISLLL